MWLMEVDVGYELAKIAARIMGTKKLQPCQEQSDAVAGGDEDDVDRVASGALEPVTLEFSVGLKIHDIWNQSRQ